MSSGKTQDSLMHQPTMLETQLDSICLLLGKMKSRVRSVDVLEHLTDAERRELDAALDRTRSKISELEHTIRGNA